MMEASKILTALCGSAMMVLGIGIAVWLLIYSKKEKYEHTWPVWAFLIIMVIALIFWNVLLYYYQP